jgi:hypothetical protein
MTDEKKTTGTGLAAGVASFMRKNKQPPAAPAQAAKPEKTKKSLTVWLDPVVVRQFKIVSAESGRTQEALMNDMMNWLFKQHGKPEIA